MMSELIKFSLQRRFVNKTNKVVLIVLMMICLILGFIDPLIKLINPHFNEPLKISAQVEDITLLKTSLIEEVIFDQKSELKVIEQKGQYTVHSLQPLNELEKAMVQQVITNYEKQKLMKYQPSSVHVFKKMASIPIDFKAQQQIETNQDSLFFVITGIYFMMLGFAGILASEVVAEKTSNILEIIGTSVSLKTHYYSKIVIGWLTIFIQVGVGVCLFLITFFSRYLFDKGSGLLELLYKVKVVPVHFKNFDEMLQQLFKDGAIWGSLLIGLVFLFVGILFIQMILVLLTTKVNSVEEAGSLQNPFYILLLVLYYVTLMLNHPQSLTNGLGMMLSFVPIFSMLLMPARLMMVHPALWEVLISLLISVVSLGVFIKIGESIYCRNILNFSRKKQKIIS